MATAFTLKIKIVDQYTGEVLLNSFDVHSLDQARAELNAELDAQETSESITWSIWNYDRKIESGHEPAPDFQAS